MSFIACVSLQKQLKQIFIFCICICEELLVPEIGLTCSNFFWIDVFGLFSKARAMFGLIIFDTSSSDVIFEDNCQDLIGKMRNSGHRSDDYLMQIFSPILLSRKVFKSEKKNLEFSILRFGKSRMAFADRNSFTFVFVAKSCSESEVNSFMEMAIVFTDALVGPDILSLKVV